jgi:hypothetical protein
MYQAPEALQPSSQARVGLPSDVFSFAIILWEMISGEEPYKVFFGSLLTYADVC